MRLPHRLLLSFLLVFVYAHLTTASYDNLHIRQDGADSSATAAQTTAASTAVESAQSTITSTNTASAAQSSTASSEVASSTESASSISSAAASATSTATASDDAATSATTTSSTISSISTDVVYSGHGLPLQPRITPAVGIAGVVLIVSGFAYTLIGIRKRRVMISFSTAYLVALAVWVLIEYTMTPPVSDAVQGAFFVAVCVTGAIFGGLSLVFSEMTDGLGCLLGGFCLSMWFLVLRPGGLTSSTIGKVVLIVVLSLLGYGLSFSHYTRTYGLLGCTAFAGATITVLGIDCFSRAGLKEFWLYIWGLNDKIFPLKTNTYPITRGIRVEIACIIIIFLFGVASQLKLWNLVKEKRAEKDAQRLKEEKDHEAQEEEVGRRVEEDRNRELAQWELMYGGKDAAVVHSDTAKGSTESIRKGAVNIHEVRRSESGDSVEMNDLRRSKDGSENDLISRRTSKRTSNAQDDQIQQIDARGIPIPGSTPLSPEDTKQTHSTANVRQSVDRKDSAHTDNRADRSKTKLAVSSPPPVVPLPFVVPTGDDSESEIGEQAYVASLPEALQEQQPNRFSSTSGKRSSNVRNPTSTSEEALIVPLLEDDRASSVAATLDDINEEVISLPALSRQATPSVLSLGGFKTASELAFGELDDEEINAHRQQAFLELESQSLTTSTEPKSGEENGRRASQTSASRDGDGSNGDRSRSRRSTSLSGPTGNLRDHLPERMSNVVLTYRTNEWAKHLPQAEKPELEPIPEPSSPGIRVRTSRVHAAEPAQKSPTSPTGSQRDHLLRDASELPATDPYRQPLLGQSSELAVNASRNSIDTPYKTSSINPQAALQRSASASTTPTGSGLGSSLSSSARGFRASSTPLTTPLVEQTLAEYPTEEAIDEDQMTNRYAPTPMPTNTLMGRRETMMRSKKFSTMSFQSPSKEVITPGDSISVRSVQMDEPDSDHVSLAERKQQLDEDNMTLAQRKALIQHRRSSQQQQQPQQQQQQQPQQQQQQQQQKPHRHSSSNRPPAKPAAFNSHQPKRGYDYDRARRETMMNQWRSTLQQDLHPAQPAQQADEGRRTAMLETNRHRDLLRQHQVIAQGERDSAMDEMMRQGHMLDLHQKSMRRMQAMANKNA